MPPKITVSHPITPRQQQVMDTILAHIEKHNVTPTLQEIADTMGFASTFAVVDHVRKLKAKGYLQNENKRIAPTQKKHVTMVMEKPEE